MLSKTKRFSLYLLATLMAVVFTASQTLQTAQADGLKVFANVPANPGTPEGIALHGNRVYVSGPARFGTAGTGPSAIHVYKRNNGDLITTIFVTGEALQFEHALSNIVVDGDGRVYALSTQLGVLRFTKQGNNYVQEFYGAPLPDLPSYLNVPVGVPSSPTILDLPPIPNDLVFDAEGNLYVTDSLQATIFRYSPGGGQPQIWFQSAAFEGGGVFPFGTNGIRLDPDRQYAYVATTTSFNNPARGAIYRIPLEDAPAAGSEELVIEYMNGEAPDQIAFSKKGNLYVTLAFANQVSIVSPDGIELDRMGSDPDDEIPLDNPAALVFDTRSKKLLIVNHSAFAMNPAHYAVLSLDVDEKGDNLETP